MGAPVTPGRAIARFGSRRPFVHGGGVVYRTGAGPVLWFTYGQDEVFDSTPYVYVHRIPLYSNRADFERAYPGLTGGSIEERMRVIERAIRERGATHFDPRPIAVRYAAPK